MDMDLDELNSSKFTPPEGLSPSLGAIYEEIARK
jgi:hypothetical protein